MLLTLAAAGGALVGAAVMRVYDVLRERKLLRTVQARLNLERASRARQSADKEERQALRGAHQALGELAHESTLCHFARLEAARRTGRPYHSAASDDQQWRQRVALRQLEVDRYASLLGRSGLVRTLGQLRAACERVARCEDPALAERLHARVASGIRVAQEMIGARLVHLEHEASTTDPPRTPTRGNGGPTTPGETHPAS
jgi:hypothetical protein